MRKENTSLHFNLATRALASVALFFCISSSCLFAQTNKIDSLKQKLASTPESESFEINFQLARESAYVDNKIAVDYVRKAKSLAYLKQDSLNIIRSLRLLGQIHRRLDNLDSSLYYLLKGLPIADRKEFDEERNVILNSLGIVYLNLTKYDRALYYFLRSANLYEKSGDKSMSGVVENNLGTVYYKLNDFKMALEHFNKSLTIKTTIMDSFGMDILLINMSLCDAHLGNLIEARNRLIPVIEKCILGCDDDIFINTLYTSGVIWHKSDSLRNAERDFLQSYTRAKKVNNHRFQFDNIIYLSQIYLKQHNFLLAEQFLVDGERMTAVSDFDLEEMNLYEQLSALYKIKGNYKKLSSCQEKFIQIKDSIYTQDKANNLMRLHSEATEKENRTQLALQEKMLQLKNKNINKQLGINILIGFAIVLLASLIYVLVKLFQQRKEANYLLNKKVTERNDELLQNYENVKLALEQRDLALTRLSKDFIYSIESMRTLCLAGTKAEANDNALYYFDEINATTLSLSNSLNSILSESK